MGGSTGQAVAALVEGDDAAPAQMTGGALPVPRVGAEAVQEQDRGPGRLVRALPLQVVEVDAGAAQPAFAGPGAQRFEATVSCSRSCRLSSAESSDALSRPAIDFFNRSGSIRSKVVRASSGPAT